MACYRVNFLKSTKWTIHLHLILRLRMNPAIPLLPVHASMVWTGTTLTLPFFVLRFHPVEGLFVSGVSW